MMSGVLAPTAVLQNTPHVEDNPEDTIARGGPAPPLEHVDLARRRNATMRDHQLPWKRNCRTPTDEAPATSRFQSSAVPRRAIAQVTSFPDVATWKSAPHEEKLQEWEGRVVRIFRDHFVAYLVDLTKREDHETEEGKFPLTEVSDSDLPLLCENAIFRWVIGYRAIGGTKERFARIVFRRLPTWSQREITAADELAQRWVRQLVWD